MNKYTIGTSSRDLEGYFTNLKNNRLYTYKVIDFEDIKTEFIDDNTVSRFNSIRLGYLMKYTILNITVVC